MYTTIVDVVVTVRVPAEVARQIDAVAAGLRVSRELATRSDALRALIARGLVALGLDDAEARR